MIKTAAIICEYNPFHNGHSHQIAHVREIFGDCAVICVMSGNFVQRGDAAIADKYTRAQAALHGGADLVLELPFPYSAASAEYFARAGVTVAAAFGADCLCFGSECGDVDALRRIAKAVGSDEFRQTLAAADDDRANDSVPYAVLRERAVASLLSPADAAILKSPNDILGVEYIHAAAKIAPEMFMYAAERAQGPRFMSAADIRSQISLDNFDSLRQVMPPHSLELLEGCIENGGSPATLANAERAVLAWLRLCDAAAVDAAAEAHGGLSRRLMTAARQASTLSELTSAAATKKYTDAKIRRVILFALTGVTGDDLNALPAYTILLGANDRGRRILAASEPSLPVITKPADYNRYGAAVSEQFRLCIRAESLYTLCLPRPCEAGKFLKKSPVIIK